MTQNELIFAPIHADIALARDEVRRAARSCTPKKCVCREAHRELMLRVVVLRVVQEMQPELIEPGSEPWIGQVTLHNYRNILHFERTERRDLARQRERMRASGLSEREIAADPPRTRRQRKRDEQRALYIKHCLHCDLNPWERMRRPG